jgi:rhamnogalacturonyl hydrolase YesR
MVYKIYCFIHRLAKQILQRKGKPNYRMISLNPSSFSKNEEIEINGSYINDIEIEMPTNINKKNLFPVENIVAIGSNSNLKDSYVRNKKSNLSLGVNMNDAKITWESFLNASIIPTGYKNGGLHYTGYIADDINEWCLPSWVWTNAALVRMYCNNGETTKAIQIGDLLLKQQLECGGWIVRNDYKSEGAIPTLAPNDSAYIANNSFIELYKVTKNEIYLDAAKKCADWIIESARPDGLVWSGYDMKRKEWDKDYIIVDTGFTAGLFANLYDITQDKKYKIFLEKFVNQYINLFFNPSNKGFSTSINKQNKQTGGVFARGQAWALEGLIPAYSVLKTEELKQVIDLTISNLLEKQLQNGGWSYNFPKPLLGEDCKGVSVLAKSLMEWNLIEQNDKVIISVNRALEWCIKQTASKGECKGGIFSFCMEGAVVHNFYTKTAFVYSSAYAIELYNMLKEER